MSECIAYSVPNAAMRAGISRSMLYELIAVGDVPIVKVRGRSLVLDSDLRAFLERCRVASASTGAPARPRLQRAGERQAAG